jgi:hypothetical protein
MVVVPQLQKESSFQAVLYLLSFQLSAAHPQGHA